MDNALAPQAGPPAALFEGGPKSPEDGKHKPFHWLSWVFHRVRFERLQDRYFDPWEGKHLKCCDRIVKKARGDEQEITRRARHLWMWVQINPDFYRFTPECLLSRWDDLHLPPTDSIGGRRVMREHAKKAGRDAAREQINAKYGAQG